MPNVKVLIVDDEWDLIQLLETKLKTAGYVTDTATRGEQALTVAREFEPDLVLMDIVLPDRDGPEVIRSMQEEGSLRDVPVIFLSGIVTRGDSDAEETSTVKVGDRVYPAIGKPFAFDDLMKMMEEILTREPSRGN